MKKDGTRLKPNQVVLEVSGSARTVLSCERTVLNLLSRMSGIATHTSFLVSKIKKQTKRQAFIQQERLHRDSDILTKRLSKLVEGTSIEWHWMTWL